MTEQSNLTRRSLMKIAAASGLALPILAGTASFAAQNSKRLILGTTQEPVQFNPLLYTNAGAENIPEACMFDALWDVNEKGEFIPNLATEVPSIQNGGISHDGLTWRISLRKDVSWTDGKPFTARDVEFTFHSIVNPKIAARSRSGFTLIESFKVLDDFGIEMKLSRPYIPFLWAWQNMHIVPEHLLAAEPDFNTASYNQNPIGTGPYILKSRVAGSHMVYEANPNYHRGAPKIPQFIHKFVTDQLVAFGQVRTGEIDYLGVQGVPFDRWNEAAKLSGKTFFPLGQPYVQFIYFNCGKPQFADPLVRRALYTALPMQRSIDDVYFGTYKRTLSYLHPSHWAYNKDLKETTSDPVSAAKMLDQAGWKLGPDGIREKNGVKLSFTMSTTAGVPARQATQALFQQSWKEIGVMMEIKNMPASVVWGEYTTKSQFDTLLVAYEPPVGMDPDYSARCHSGGIPTKGGNGANYVQYENAEVDALLDQGVKQTDIEERKKTYARLQEILLEEVPFAPHGAVYQGQIFDSKLKGIKANQYVVDATWNVHEWSWT